MNKSNKDYDFEIKPVSPPSKVRYVSPFPNAKPGTVTIQPVIAVPDDSVMENFPTIGNIND
ncbi:putative orfan [Tupanvirus soda lake]|uniref:Orfan n=1 Tax=Tupanvirus deep ocean TaxID=2126984 RepID=A0AC59HBX5_9VIRU|nr:putative orfan [Tupanvirus soda lake]AUL78548.2 putative orfan [Tupanvirus soda lake]